MSEKYLYCPFCKSTKLGRAKAYSYYEYRDHLTEEHHSDHVKASGNVILASELKELIRKLRDFGVIK